MPGLLLNCCYFAALLLASPVLLWKRLREGKYREGWRHKLWGGLPERTDRTRPLLWLHAVSVGEVLQLRQVVAGLRREGGDLQILVTTTTSTGFDVARKSLGDCQVAWFPLDFTWSVRRAFKRVRPDLIVLVELELWPNFVLEATRRRVPLALVNGRMSERSFRGYLRIRPLTRGLLRCFSRIAVQTPEYRERFLSLGAPEDRLVVTGSIKFDGVETDRNNPRTQELREWLRIAGGERVFIAGSTQEPEEGLAVEAYRSLLREYPGLRLIVVPRHPERGDAVAELIRAAGFRVRRRSSPESSPVAATGGLSDAPVVGLLDTVGELGDCWGLADVAFVGGSFGSRGGQNMLEPAAYGAAVCFGPNTRNFRQVVELLKSGDAARTVASPAELREFAATMLASPAAASAMGGRAQRLVLAQRGATARTVSLLTHLLDALRREETAPRRAA